MENKDISPSTFFNPETFVQRGNVMLEMVKKCWQKMSQGRVNPGVEHGFLRQQLDNEAPEEGTKFERVCEEVEQKYFPGILHWQSPRFFAYFPSCISQAGTLSEIFANTFATPGFNYAVSPSHTELENVMVDWSAKALNLPQRFLIKNQGGGVIQSSATEAVFLAVHAAKIKKLKSRKMELCNPDIVKLVGYVSESAHICTLRSLLLKDIAHQRVVPCVFDKEVGNYLVDMDKFREILKKDIDDGLIPFFYGASIGTTFSAAIDQIEEIGKICKQHEMWLNIDAAYLGSTWLCQEMRKTQRGIEMADSIMINLSKPLFMGNGGTLFYVANKQVFLQAMGQKLEFSFYKNKYSEEKNTIDYKDWQVGLNKRNNALRLFFIYKMYGLKLLKESIRYRDRLAQTVQERIKQSKFLQPFSQRAFSLNVFQVKHEDQQKRNEFTKKLGLAIKDTEEGYCTPAAFKGNEVVRLVVCNPNTTLEHVEKYLKRIETEAERLLSAVQ